MPPSSCLIHTFSSHLIPISPERQASPFWRAQTTAGLAFLSRRIPHLFLSACSTLQTLELSLAPSRLVTTPNHPNSTPSPPKSAARYSKHPYPTTPHLHARSPTVVCPSRTSRPSVSRDPRGACQAATDTMFTDPFAEADEDTGQVKQTQQDYIHIRIQRTSLTHRPCPLIQSPHHAPKPLAHLTPAYNGPHLPHAIFSAVPG